MDVKAICALPVSEAMAATAHLYLWVPNALLPEGLEVLKAWGFNYKSNIIWHKLRKDGGSDGAGRSVFIFVTLQKFSSSACAAKMPEPRHPGRTQVNYIGTRKREHSRKPDEQYALIEGCSQGPYLEIFARGARPNWTVWGSQALETYEPTWKTYAHNSATDRNLFSIGETCDLI